jgi:hypothetical protein
MNNEISTIDDRLDRTIAGILAQPVPDFPNPAISFPQRRRPVVPATRFPAGGVSRRRWLAVGSASLATAGLLSAMFFAWPQDSWAQVVKAVRNKPWVRLRMSMPENDRVEKQRGIDIWFSPARQIIAGRIPGSTLLIELEQQRKHRYDEATQTIYISDSDTYDEDEFASLNAVLQSFQSQQELQQPKGAKAKLLSQTRQEGREGERAWTDYIFTYEDPRRTPAQYRRIFHVPTGATLPTSMAEEWTYDGKTNSRVMEMDYPEFGPLNLADLDVPKDAKVVDTHSNDDLKSVLKSYAEHQHAAVDRYSALALRTVVEKPDWKWVNEMYKVNCDSTGYTSETGDLEPLMNLSLSVHEGKVEIPESPADRLEWWKAEASKLGFTPFGGTTEIQVFAPDRVGYPELGIPNQNVQATLESKPVLGPGDAVMISVAETKSGKIKFRYWLAPSRNFMCVRLEHHPASGYLSENKDWISTTIVDAAEKSPTGRWYATQIRQGVVKTSGDDLEFGMAAGAPYGTSTWRFLVDFEK